jgi:hypothetical protein
LVKRPRAVQALVDAHDTAPSWTLLPAGRLARRCTDQLDPFQRSA